MKTNIIISFIILFPYFLFSVNQDDKNYNIPIIYKDKPKKKIPEKEKLNRKKKKYWEKSNRIFHRFARNSKFSDNNPSNLAIKSPFYYFRIDFLNIDLNFTNKSISPQLLIDHFTSGERLNSTSQNEISSSFENLYLMTNLNVKPLRIELGKMLFSSNIHNMINGNFQGELLSIPFSNLGLGNEYNQNLDIEILSYIKNSIGLGRSFKTNFATFRAGINYNYLMGLAYLKTEIDTFSLINELGNVNANINLSIEGNKLIWDALSDSGLTQITNNHFSEISNGFDLGFGVNLKKLIHQNFDIELLIENISSSLTFKNSTKKTYSTNIYANNLIEFGDSLSNNTIDTLSINKNISIEIPSITSILATYQPIPQLVVSRGFKKYSKNFIINNSKPNIYLKTALYPNNWLNISYGIQSKNSQIIQSLGLGFQSNIIDLLVDLSSYDGILNSSNGLGISFRLSLYF